MYYGNIIKADIANGTGIRVSLFVSGCTNHCKGCFQPQTWDFEGGGLVPVEMVIDAIDELEYHTGLTLSGGDPLYQVHECLEIIKYARKNPQWLWAILCLYVLFCAVNIVG